MDLDWKIKQLEENLRHEQEMRKLQGDRLDTHDQHFAQLHLTLTEITNTINETNRLVAQLAVEQTKTEMMLQNLIQTIAREHTNGKSSS